MKRKLVSVLCLATIIALASCANLTPKQRYYAALKTWDDNVETYLIAYKAASPETQARWKANIDPLIKAANAALDVWHQSIYAPDALAKEQVWINAQRQAINMLIASGIVKVEGR